MESGEVKAEPRRKPPQHRLPWGPSTLLLTGLCADSKTRLSCFFIFFTSVMIYRIYLHTRS